MSLPNIHRLVFFQVVIGGVNVDFTAAFKDDKVKVSFIKVKLDDFGFL